MTPHSVPPLDGSPAGSPGAGDAPVPDPVRVEVEGIALGVIDLPGPGRPDQPTYVLVHGIGMSHRSFDRLAVRLAASGRVVSFDLAGFGANPTPSVRVRIEDHARLLARVLDGRDARRRIVVGHSMGAQVALELALVAPEQVDGVVLIGPVVDPRRRSMLHQAGLLGRDSAKEPGATQRLVLTDYVRGGLVWYLRQLRAMFAYRTDERVHELDRPLLVVRGEDDPIAVTAWCEQLAASGRPGRVTVVPGSRHVVPHAAPDELAAEVVAFAAEAAGSAGSAGTTGTTGTVDPAPGRP